MSLDNFINDVVSTRIQANLDNSLAAMRFVTMDWQGDATYGNAVKINTLTTPSVADYAGTVSYATPASSQVSLLVDQQKSIALDFDDIKVWQSGDPQLIDKYASRYAYAFANSVDAYVMGLHGSATATAVSLDLTVASPEVYKALVTAGKSLDNAKVPRAGRWCLITPEMLYALQLDGKVSGDTNFGDEVRVSGRVARLAGFDLYLAHNVIEEVVAGTPNTTWHRAMFGGADSVAYAGQIALTEALRREGSYSTAVRSLLTFGAKVIQPSAVGVINAQIE